MKKAVEFTVEGETLRGSFYIPEGIQSPPAVILFHGSGSKGLALQALAEKLMNNGIFAFFFYFRGCGESDGNYYEQTVAEALKDSRRGFDFLLEQKIDHMRIGVVGSSFGGNLATLILKEYPVKSLILKAPSTQVGELTSKIDMGTEENEHNYFFNHSDEWGNAQNFANIKEFGGKLLIVEGSRDYIIPHDMTQKYFDSAVNAKNKKLEVIKGADHRLSDGKWTAEFIDLSIEWFLETLL